MTRATKHTGADLVDQLFKAAFDRPRDPCSPEYRAGVRAWLNLRANDMPYVCPFAPGSASSDAFYAGVDEGRCIWRTYLDAEARRKAADTSSDGA